MLAWQRTGTDTGQEANGTFVSTEEEGKMKAGKESINGESARSRVKVKEVTGVYVRDARNPKTKKMDLAFDITFREKVGEKWKTRFEPVGWESEGMNPRKAEKERDKRLAKISLGEATRATDREQKKAQRTIGAFFDETVMIYQEANNKTWKRTQSRFNTHVRPVFGHLQFHQVTIDMVCKWRDEKKAKGLKDATVAIHMNILHQIFRMAEAHEVIKHNPFNEKILSGGRTVPKIGIPKPKNNNRERALTREEADILMNAAIKWRDRKMGSGGDPDMADIILIAIRHGLRADEVASLQWKDIVFEFDHIMLWDQKNGKKEAFRMAPSVREMLQKRAEKKPKPEDLVFPGPVSGKKRKDICIPFGKIVATTELNRGRENDPYQKVVFHSLRHTLGTWLALAGKDLKTIQKIMRHSDIKDTLRYMNHAHGYADQVISELDSSWVAPSPFEADSESLPANVIAMPLKR